MSGTPQIGDYSKIADQLEREADHCEYQGAIAVARSLRRKAVRYRAKEAEL